MPARRSMTVTVLTDRCKGIEGCGLCIHVCPAGVFEPAARTGKGVVPPSAAHADACTGCERCMVFCPDFAIVVEAAGADKMKDEG